MRIGYLYNLHAYPPQGGNHTHVVELIKGFLALGHSVSVVDDPTMPEVKNFQDKNESLREFINNVDVLYVRIDARFTRHWKALKECVALDNSCPVIWEINAPANETLAFSWLGGKSLLVDKEDLIRKLRRFTHANLKYPGIFLEEFNRKKLAKNVSFAICVSHALENYAKEDLRIKNILVLPNGGPLITEKEINKRKNNHVNKRFTVLYIGSAIYPWQGLNYLSATISLAKDVAPDIIFVLAVNQKTDNLPTSDNVIHYEKLNRNEILDVICSADACISLHPEYFWSKYRFHGSGIKFFEYMACMSPVVASNLGQMKEIINHKINGLLCENKPEDILKKLIYLRDHPEQAANIGRRGWELIQSRYNWKVNAERSVEIFEKAILLANEKS